MTMPDRPSQPLVTPEQEIAILRARIVELEHALETARVERDDALRILREASFDASGAAGRDEGPLADGACPHCEGYGSHWIHDIEMPCLKCGGTGRVPAS